MSDDTATTSKTKRTYIYKRGNYIRDALFIWNKITIENFLSSCNL